MERGAFELASALAVNKYLIFLNLTGNSIGNEGLSYLLPAIAHCGTLERLDISSNEITSGPIRQLILKEKARQGHVNPFFQDLDFRALMPFKNNRLMEEDQGEIKRYRLQTAFLIEEFLSRATCLKEFVIKGNKIGDEGMRHISKAFAEQKSRL